MASHPAALSLTGHAGGCYAAMWHPKKEALMSGGRDGHVRVWGKDGEEILAFPAHEGAIYRMAMTQGKLWTASRDKTVKSWSMDDLSPLQKITFKNGGSNGGINALRVCVRSSPSNPQDIRRVAQATHLPEKMDVNQKIRGRQIADLGEAPRK